MIFIISCYFMNEQFKITGNIIQENFRSENIFRYLKIDNVGYLIINLFITNNLNSWNFFFCTYVCALNTINTKRRKAVFKRIEEKEKSQHSFAVCININFQGLEIQKFLAHIIFKFNSKFFYKNKILNL